MIYCYILFMNRHSAVNTNVIIFKYWFVVFKIDFSIIIRTFIFVLIHEKFQFTILAILFYRFYLFFQSCMSAPARTIFRSLFKFKTHFFKVFPIIIGRFFTIPYFNIVSHIKHRHGTSSILAQHQSFTL